MRKLRLLLIVFLVMSLVGSASANDIPEVFDSEEDWLLGEPEPPHTWSAGTEMSFDSGPDGNTALRFDENSPSTNTYNYWKIDIDASQYDNFTVYHRKDDHTGRDMRIRDLTNGNDFYKSGSTFSWQENTYDLSDLEGEITLGFGVQSSSGTTSWNAGFAQLSFRPHESTDKICDERGPNEECIADSDHSVSGDTYEIETPFISEKSALFDATSQTASINFNDKTEISGFWKGSFNLNTEETPVIKSGSRFEPVNGDIKIG